VNATLIRASLGVAVLGIGVGGARAQQVVGTPSQVNGQSNTVSQVGVQSGGGPTPFASKTVKTQSNTTNDQSTSKEQIDPAGVGNGGILIGDSGQRSAQNDMTIQSLQGGKTQTNVTITDQDGGQNVAGGASRDSIVVGSPAQLQWQAETTLQGTKTGATGAVIKAPYQNSTNSQSATTDNCQSVAGATVCLI
jgi:hypothetical protein